MRRLVLLLLVLTGLSARAWAAPALILPQPGRGVRSATLSSAGHLVLSYDDGTSQDVGSVTAAAGASVARAVSVGAQASVVVSMGSTAPNGWACSASDLTTTTPALAVAKETATTPTSVTVSAFSDLVAPSAFAAGDVLQLACTPY